MAPAPRVADALQDFPRTPCALLAIGKAAAGMSDGAFRVLADNIRQAFIVAPADADAAFPRTQAIRGDHPLPGRNSIAAGAALHDWLQVLPEGMPLLVLVSGGGSAMLELPVESMCLQDLRRMNEWLLGSGLPIHDINAVRARFSRLKAGGLLQLAGARPVYGLMMSDVPGDAVEDIASGPLSPRPFAWPEIEGMPEWLRALHARLPLPSRVTQSTADIRVIGSNRIALDAISGAVTAAGERVVQRGELRGDAAMQGKRIAQEILAGVPGIYLYGGESTVQLPAQAGRGGRNQQLALAAALAFEGRELQLLALATDGIDGNCNDAGACVDGGTANRVRDAGMDPAALLQRADSNRALAASGDLVDTGATGTNVMDFVIAWKPG